MERARELDPLSLIIKANVGIVYYFARRYDETIEQLETLAKEEAEFPVAHWGLGLAGPRCSRISRWIRGSMRCATTRASAICCGG